MFKNACELYVFNFTLLFTYLVYLKAYMSYPYVRTTNGELGATLQQPPRSYLITFVLTISSHQLEVGTTLNPIFYSHHSY